MALSPDETYVQTYQKYLKHKESSEDLRKLTSTASTKVLKPVLADKDCKICRVLAKPGDLCRVLNQGLYHKYTSSQDYFYTRDINTLLAKKRKSFSVRYHDDLIYDECKERLKAYFKKKDSVSLMSEIKLFYTKFKNFPRNFHLSFFNIINSNIRKHRRIEYMRVFHGVNLDDEKLPEENNQADAKDTSKNKEDKEFNIMELLGESFVKENYKDVSNFAIGGISVEKPIDTARSVKEIEENFKALWKAPEKAVNDLNSAAFSNALYNKNYMLYSRSDSQTAEDILKQIVNEFKEEATTKASVTLADKVLHQVASAAAANSKKQENNRFSTVIRQRTEEGFEFSPLLQGSKKSLGSGSNFNTTASSSVQPQPMIRQQSSININTSNRVQSNPRTHSRGEVDTNNILGKVNQSKIYEQRKSTEKFSVEHLNDIVINRNKILSNLYQFRSTRSKSGGLKSVGSTSKTPSHKNGFPMGVIGEINGAEIMHYPQAPYNATEKSVSPDRRASKEDPRPIAEMIARPKLSLDPSAQSTMKRSASQGLHGDLRETSSPMVSQINQSIQHKKTNSVMKKRGVATPIRHGVNPATIQNFTIANNSTTIQNMSNSHQDTTISPNHGKFINPMRNSLGATQQYYFRHQSPMDEKIAQGGSAVYHPKGVSEPMIKNLNIRSMKHTMPDRVDNNCRTNTLSTSGRNLLDSSQTAQLNKTGPDQMRVKKIEKANMQTFAAKIIKRASLAPNNIITPVLEIEENDRRPKKILELGESNYNGFRDLKLPSREQTPLNIGPSSTSSLNKFKVEVKKNSWSSYNLKGAAMKDNAIRLVMKK